MSSDVSSSGQVPKENRGFVYLLTGPSHGVRLVVSLWSLRQYYNGPVVVITAHEDSHRIGELCARDERLGVEHHTSSMYHVKTNASYLTKVSILRSLPFEVSTYLDADTIVSGDVLELLDVPKNIEMRATQFSNWTSRTRSPLGIKPKST